MMWHHRKALALSFPVVLFVAISSIASAVQGANGTWTDINSNDWSNLNTSSWLTGIVADGSGNTADFSTIDLPADIAVNVVDARTIGNMVFGDTETVNTPASWNLSGNTITLLGTTPTITVNALGAGKTATIANVIAGTAGMTKAGPGTLVLTGNNTITGGVTISGGMLDTSSGGTVLAKQIITLTNGGTWRFVNAPIPTTSASGWGMRASGTSQPPTYDATIGAIWVPAGQTGTLAPAAGANVGQVGGGAGSMLNVQVANNSTFHVMGSWRTNAPAASNSGGNLGTVNFTVATPGGAGKVILANQTNKSGLLNNVDRFDNNSFQSTAVNVGDGITLFTRTGSGGNTIPLGSLSGGSDAVLAGGAESSGIFATYSIGSLNTNTEFAGTITSENVTNVSGGSSTAGSTNITKVGTGTLTLSGPLLYTPNATRPNPNQRGGLTTISAGILALKNASAFASGPDATNPNSIIIAAAGTLDVAQSTNTYTSATTGLPVTGYSSVPLTQVLGTGTITGNYNHAGGVLAPGNTLLAPSSGTTATPISNTPVAGTLTFTNNLSFSGSGAIAFDLSNPTSGNDLIQVGGGDVGGTPTLALNFLSAPTPGVYTIINSNSALTGSLLGWAVGFTGRGSAPTLSLSGDQKQVLLSIGASSFGNVNWQGSADGTTWDVQTTANWHNTAPAQRIQTNSLRAIRLIFLIRLTA